MKINKEKNSSKYVVEYISNYSKIYQILLIVIAFFELVLTIRGFQIYTFQKIKHYVFIFSYIFLFLMSVITIIFITLVRSKKLPKNIYLYVLNAYAACIILWSVVISYYDMLSGDYPIVYLTIIIVLASIVVIDVKYYAVLVLSSFLILLFTVLFGSNDKGLSTGDFINIFVFVFMSLFVSYRQYKVSINEAKTNEYLNRLSRIDPLTKLYNELRYQEVVEEINGKIKKNQKVAYAVLICDLNGLKHTNDLYGHRFGCYLVEETGRRIPKIFENSTCFHIGGDEFQVIIQGKDLLNLDECLEQFRNALEYQEIELDGIKLTLSVAHGVGIYSPNLRFQDVYQEADDQMYLNKKMLKEKYNIASR